MPYIEDSINYTRAAYGLNDIDEVYYPNNVELNNSIESSPSITNARIFDWRAMIPFLQRRVNDFADFGEMRLHTDLKQHLRKPVIDYLKMFYVDTAIYGNTPGLMCSYSLYGAQHMLFATDFPYDTQWGLRHNRATIESVQNMDISSGEKRMIFEGNARSLLRLPV